MDGVKCSCLFFSPTFKLSEDSCPEKRLVIIQCDSGHLNGDLIACARYRIHDLKIKADKEQITHVLFIIHLPHQVRNSSFVGFQGHPWISSYIDDLRPTTDYVVSANVALGKTISEIFLESNNPDPQAESASQGDDNSVNEGFERQINNKETHSKAETVSSGSILFCRLHGCIQAAVSKLNDATAKRSIKRIEIMANLIPKEPTKILGTQTVNRLYAN